MVLDAGTELKVMVTGASGFVGSQVAHEFRVQGFETVLLAGRGGSHERINGRFRSAQIISVDLLDGDKVSKIVQEIRPDICVHLGWYAVPGKYLSSLRNIDMISATMNLASALVDAGCDRLVGVGSCFEYDLAFGYLSESLTATVPNSLYGVAKLSTANLLGQYAKNTGISVAWARLFYLYGPYENAARLVPAMILPLIRGEEAKSTGGRQIRDYLHVEDAARALVAIALSKIEGPVNVGSGVPISLCSLIESIGLKTGRPDLLQLGSMPYREDEVPFIVADNSLLISQTDWVQEIEIVDGIDSTVEWWKQNAT